jgi:hypothetical protein
MATILFDNPHNFATATEVFFKHDTECGTFHVAAFRNAGGNLEVSAWDDEDEIFVVENRIFPNPQTTIEFVVDVAKKMI